MATNLLDVRKLPPTVLGEGVDDGVNDIPNARMLNAVIGARIILVDRLKPAHIIVRLNIPIGTRPSQPACAAAQGCVHRDRSAGVLRGRRYAR